MHYISGTCDDVKRIHPNWILSKNLPTRYATSSGRILWLASPHISNERLTFAHLLWMLTIFPWVTCVITLFLFEFLSSSMSLVWKKSSYGFKIVWLYNFHHLVLRSFDCIQFSSTWCIIPPTDIMWIFIRVFVYYFAYKKTKCSDSILCPVSKVQNHRILIWPRFKFTHYDFNHISITM